MVMPLGAHVADMMLWLTQRADVVRALMMRPQYRAKSFADVDFVVHTLKGEFPANVYFATSSTAVCSSMFRALAGVDDVAESWRNNKTSLRIHQMHAGRVGHLAWSGGFHDIVKGCTRHNPRDWCPCFSDRQRVERECQVFWIQCENLEFVFDAINGNAVTADIGKRRAHVYEGVSEPGFPTIEKCRAMARHINSILHDDVRQQGQTHDDCFEDTPRVLWGAAVGHVDFRAFVQWCESI